jgi:hypothetical protein
VTEVKDGVATIETNVGTIKADVSDLGDWAKVSEGAPSNWLGISLWAWILIFIFVVLLIVVIVRRR